MACSSVVLPTPLGPVSTVTEPGSMSASSASMWIGAPPSSTVHLPAGAVGSCRSDANALSAAVFPSCAAWNATPTRRSGQNTSGANSRAVRPAASVISPYTSRSPDAHRDERDTEGGQQFQHERRQECDPQRGHRRTAMCRTEFGDPSRRAADAARAPAASAGPRRGRAAGPAVWSSPPAPRPSGQRWPARSAP